jgi:hypothetical protein
MPAQTGDGIQEIADSHLSIEPFNMHVNDACRFTGISRSTLYLLIASSDVEIIKLGTSNLVVAESLRRFVNAKRCCIWSHRSGRTNCSVGKKTSGNSGQDSVVRP